MLYFCRSNRKPGKDDDFDLTEDIDGDPKENIDHFMAILIECLALLGILPEAVEVIFSYLSCFSF